MQAMIDDIRSVFEDVWNSLLENSLQESPWNQVQAEAESCLSTWVCFSVGWHGALHLTCSVDLAKQVAASLFGGEPDERSMEDAEDALGELANMVGGNIKSLMPSPCFISVPESMQGLDARVVAANRELETELSFASGSQQLRLRLLRAHDPDSGGAR